MTTPTLNERAAKCMGWEYDGYCAVDPSDPTTRKWHSPESNLEDAARFRERAVKMCGWESFIDELARVIEPGVKPEEVSIFQWLSATPKQLCEAACRCLESIQ